MKRYNEVYSKLGKNWGLASNDQKHDLAKQMLAFLSKKNIEQEKEYAILDFMDRYIYGSNVSIDCLSLNCERGFSYYKRN